MKFRGANTIRVILVLTLFVFIYYSSFYVNRLMILSVLGFRIGFLIGFSALASNLIKKYLLPLVSNCNLIYDEYDLRIEITSLLDIGRIGWPILAGPNMNVASFNTSKRITNISFIGTFNAGKTYILSKLTGKNLRHGIDNITPGICVMIDSNDVYYEDTAGSRRPTEAVRMTDRLCTDELIQKLSISHADVVFYFADILQAQDVQHIINLCYEAKSLRDSNLKHFVVVHNFQRLTNIAQVQKYIQNDIVLPFNATETKFSSKTNSQYNYDFSKWNSHDGPEHIVLAKDGSPAGRRYNQDTLTYIRSLINDVSGRRKEINYIDALQDNIKNIIVRYFYNPSQNIDEYPVPIMNDPLQKQFRSETIGNVSNVKLEQSSISSMLSKSYHYFAKNFDWNRASDETFVNNSGADIYKNLSLDSFNISFVQDEECKNSKALFKLTTPTDLKYFPIDDPNGITPSLSFNPKHDEYASKDGNEYTIYVDLLNATFQIFFEQHSIIIQGFRAPPDGIISSKYARVNQYETIKYSSFTLVIEPPQEFDYVRVNGAPGATHNLKIDYPKTNNGQLKIVNTRKK